MKYFLGAVAFIVYIFSYVIQPEFSRQTDPYIPPPKAIQYLTAGFKIQMADSLWLRAVQDFDYCSQMVADKQCVGKSWLFSVLDLATVLDPKFEAVMYQSGGLALTVIISDYAGASVIFDRGVRIHPEDWMLLYAAGYHALYEEKNPLKAGRLYNQAYEKGAPAWVQILAGRLIAEGGDSEMGDRILEEMIAQNKEQALIDRLKLKLEEVRARKKK